MGNQVLTDNTKIQQINQFQNYSEQSLGEDTKLQINPIHQYTNYKTTLPFKSMASLRHKYKAIQQQKTSNLLKRQLLVNKKNETSQQSRQKSKMKQQKQNNHSQMINSTKFNMSNITIKENNSIKHIQQQSQKEFKSLVINFQDFVDLKEEAISDQYQFKEVLGEGAYGQVFRAICRKSGEESAIKKIKIIQIKEQKRKEFMSELNLLSKLCHPSIIVVYDVFLNDNKYYVVMQYCKGGAVVDMLHKCKNKSQNTISYIIKQLLSALSYMHSQNIVHRDIKLDNIVFLRPVSNTKKSSTKDSIVDQAIPIKIIDFGTAVAYQGKQIYNYPLAGTLSYLAPEVMKGVLTNKSDIWSVGVLLTILLTGKSPFRGSHQSVTKANINTKQLKYNEPPFNSLSSQAKQLIGMMLQRNYRKRISAAEALNHPWFSNSNNQKKLLQSQNLKQLFRYQKGNNLISVIQSYISLKKISQQERQKLGDIFNTIDTDGNGTIEMSQLIQIYTKYVDNNISNQEITQIIKSIDKDKSGKIDFNQFIIVMQGRKNLFITQFLADAFDYYDQDKTGYLDRQELTEILKGGDLTQIDKIIRQLDKDGDKCISKQEFISYFKNY